MIPKSQVMLVLLGAAIFMLVSSCATVPTEPLGSGELRLLSVEVPQKEDIRESLPFGVNIKFEADGRPDLVTACFFWSGGGPYCSKIVDVTYGSPGIIKVQLRPRSPGLIVLEGYIVYKKDGKTEMTNTVSTHIRVIRPSL